MRYYGEDFPNDYESDNESDASIIPDDYIKGIIGSVRASKPATRERAGYVYLLEVPNTPGLFKIGRTRDLDNRLRTFNVKLPFPVVYLHTIATKDCYALEAMLHNLFGSQRQGGEFFMLSVSDVQFIKSLSGD